MFAYEMYDWDPELHPEDESDCWPSNWPRDPVGNEIDYSTKFLAVKAALDAMDDYLGEHPDQDSSDMWSLIVEYQERPTTRDAWTVINWRDFNSVPPTASSLD